MTNATADAHKGEELEHRPYALGVGGTEEDDKLVRAGEEDWEQRKLLIDRLRLVEARLVCRWSRGEEGRSVRVCVCVAVAEAGCDAQAMSADRPP